MKKATWTHIDHKDIFRLSVNSEYMQVNVYVGTVKHGKLIYLVDWNACSIEMLKIWCEEKSTICKWLLNGY